MSSLDGLLKQIHERCKSHAAVYTFEEKIGDEAGARFRVKYVKLENVLQHMTDSMLAPFKTPETDLVEAEAVAIIDSNEDGYKLASFEITKDEDSKVLEHLRTEIASVIHSTSLGTPYEVINDPHWREAVKMWNENTNTREIAAHIHVNNPRTISNKMSKLRKKYGADVVLTNEERKRRSPRIL